VEKPHRHARQVREIDRERFGDDMLRSGPLGPLLWLGTAVRMSCQFPEPDVAAGSPGQEKAASAINGLEAW
jgi:hypothetical protein